jgi:hypothetical protein
LYLIRLYVLGSYGYQFDFLIDVGLSLLAGFLIGAERESRGKPAGISTHCLVIGGTNDVYQHKLIQTPHLELLLK